MTKVEQAIALINGHEDPEGVAQFILDTFNGFGRFDIGHSSMSVAEAEETMRLGVKAVRDLCRERTDQGEVGDSPALNGDAIARRARRVIDAFAEAV